MKPGLKIIDMECSVPYGAEHEKTAAAPPAQPAAGQPGYGMANYGRIFRSRSEGNDPRPKTDLDAYVKHLAGLGIVRSVPFGVSNEETTALLRRYPGRFLGLARISVNTHRGMAGDRPVLVLTSGPNRVDTDKVAGVVGQTISRANADHVRE